MNMKKKAVMWLCIATFNLCALTYWLLATGYYAMGGR